MPEQQSGLFVVRSAPRHRRARKLSELYTGSNVLIRPMSYAIDKGNVCRQCAEDFLPLKTLIAANLDKFAEVRFFKLKPLHEQLFVL